MACEWFATLDLCRFYGTEATAALTLGAGHLLSPELLLVVAREASEWVPRSDPTDDMLALYQLHFRREFEAKVASWRAQAIAVARVRVVSFFCFVFFCFCFVFVLLLIVVGWIDMVGWLAYLAWLDGMISFWLVRFFFGFFVSLPCQRLYVCVIHPGSVICCPSTGGRGAGSRFARPDPAPAIVQSPGCEQDASPSPQRGDARLPAGGRLKRVKLLYIATAVRLSYLDQLGS